MPKHFIENKRNLFDIYRESFKKAGKVQRERMFSYLITQIEMESPASDRKTKQKAKSKFEGKKTSKSDLFISYLKELTELEQLQLLLELRQLAGTLGQNDTKRGRSSQNKNKENSSKGNSSNAESSYPLILVQLLLPQTQTLPYDHNSLFPQTVFFGDEFGGPSGPTVLLTSESEVPLEESEVPCEESVVLMDNNEEIIPMNYELTPETVGEFLLASKLPFFAEISSSDDANCVQERNSLTIQKRTFEDIELKKNEHSEDLFAGEAIQKVYCYIPS